MKAFDRVPRYRSGRWVPVMAAPNADFEFTEGHIRILLWMCDSHQEWVDNACAKIMLNGEMPSDNLMRCREGIADLKCWGLRLLEIVEATPDDEEDDNEYGDEHSPQLENFASDIQAEWGIYRRTRGRSVHPVQKLRRWFVSLFG